MEHKSRSSKFGIAAIVFGLLVLVAAFALRFAGAKWRADELHRLSGEGGPVLPEDLKRAPDDRPEPTEWLGRLVSARPRWDPVELTAPQTFGALRDRAARGELGPDPEAAFAALEACTGSTNAAAVAVQQALDVLVAHDGVVATPPCGPEAVRLAAMGTAPYAEVARLAGGYGPIDPAIIAASLGATGAAFPSLPIQLEVEVGTALQLELLRALWMDHAELVPDLLRAQRDVAHIFEGAPFLVGAFGVLDAERNLLGMIELALPRLEPGTELGWLETELTALRPRARLAKAAAGERAFGNRAFEILRVGGELQGLPAHSFVPESLRISYDQAWFLAAWHDRIASLEQPAYLRAEPSKPGWFDRRMAPISSALSSAPDSVTALADELEARLVLARAALVAFRTDAKALLEFVSKTTDPFDGKPIRAGFNAEGLVLLWSVGPDRVDDGGTDDHKDIVWRYKPR